MVLIIEVSIVDFRTYFAFFGFGRNNSINNFPSFFNIISTVSKFLSVMVCFRDFLRWVILFKICTWLKLMGWVVS